MTANEENDKDRTGETREELVERLSRDEPFGKGAERGEGRESALERVQRQTEIERKRYRRPNPGQ